MSRFALAAALAVLPLAALAEVADTSTRTPADAVRWGDTGFGPQGSPVQGNFAEGAHITLIRFTDGLATPLHTHDNDYVGLVISGTTRHYTPGKPETEVLLPAGSHWFIPADLPHVSECMAGSECVMAIVQQDYMNFEAVE